MNIKTWVARNRNNEIWLHAEKPELDEATGNWISSSPYKVKLYDEMFKDIVQGQCTELININKDSQQANCKFKEGDTICPRKGWDRKWINGWPDTIIRIQNDYMWFTDRCKVHICFQSDFELVPEEK